jgi:hypothetical protein
VSKPDWKDAPEWAQHLAQDANGKWFWFECLPKWEDDFKEWRSRSGQFAEAFAPEVGNGMAERRP